MKNLIFTLAVLFVCTLSVSAQKVFNGSRFDVIPPLFTYNHTAYLYFSNGVWTKEARKIDLYDMNLNTVESLYKNGNSEFTTLYIEQYIDKNGIAYELNRDNLYLTQTLFNDDADWEYVEPVYGEITNEWGTYNDVVSYNIKKFDGTVLGSLPENKWTRDFYVINDVVYACMQEEDDVEDGKTYYFYTLPEFRKLISNPSGVEAVPAMVRTISKEVYDLMGRKASDHHKGIVIKDGKKMINK